MLCHKQHLIGLAAAAACCLPLGSAAQHTATGDAVSPPRAMTAAVPFGAPVGDRALAGLRGGSELTHNDMTLSGTTSGNTAERVVTGSNTISSGAFASMSGIPLVVQNSGANVLIQNAVIVNVKMD